MSKLTRVTLAVVCAWSMLEVPAANAGPWGRGGYGYHGGYRHYGHRRGRNIAGAVAAGAAIGLIGGAVVAAQARREREAEARLYYGRPRPYYGY